MRQNMLYDTNIGFGNLHVSDANADTWEVESNLQHSEREGLEYTPNEARSRT